MKKNSCVYVIYYVENVCGKRGGSSGKAGSCVKKWEEKVQMVGYVVVSQLGSVWPKKLL